MKNKMKKIKPPTKPTSFSYLFPIPDLWQKHYVDALTKPFKNPFNDGKGEQLELFKGEKGGNRTPY